MRISKTIITSAVFAAVLSACGGGGGSASFFFEQAAVATSAATIAAFKAVFIINRLPVSNESNPDARQGHCHANTQESLRFPIRSLRATLNLS